MSGVQNGVISLIHHPVLIDAARWSYGNLHVFTIFTFMIALRVAAPARYPRVRTTFALLHLPALIAIGVFPLAPPDWLPHPPVWHGHVPALAGSLSAVLRNQTASVASEHFSYPLLTAAETLAAARGRLLAWPIVLYPAWVFVFIVGTGHHYPLDAVVGTLCLAIGFAAAYFLHRAPQPCAEPSTPVRRWLGVALGYGLLAGWVSGLAQNSIHITDPASLTTAAPVAAAAAFAIASRRPDWTTRLNKGPASSP